jgi:hypothetical protein
MTTTTQFIDITITDITLLRTEHLLTVLRAITDIVTTTT